MHSSCTPERGVLVADVVDELDGDEEVLCSGIDISVGWGHVERICSRRSADRSNNPLHGHPARGMSGSQCICSSAGQMSNCRAREVDKMTLGKQVRVDAWQRQAGSLAYLPGGAGMLRFEKGTAG